ncbi:hypothetical protein GCM10029976_074480 [Kribbella albertanoniae]
MSIRNTVETDLDTIRTLIEQQQTVNTVTLDRYNDYLETGHYRHDWTWVVEENGVIQALAIWWGGSDDAYPYSIDGLYYAGDGDPVPTWTELIKHGMASRPPTPSRRSTTSSSTVTGSPTPPSWQRSSRG